MAKDSKFRWSKWITVIVVLGAAVGGVMYFKNDHSEAPQYQTAAVTRGDLTQAVTASGQLNPVLNVQVGSQISGNIAKLFADFNSLVKSNQVVAQLDPAIFQASVHQAEGDLANAKASLELQQVEDETLEGAVRRQAHLGVRLRHRRRHPAPGRGAGEDQAGGAGTLASWIWTTAPFTRRWTASSSRATWMWARPSRPA